MSRAETLWLVWALAFVVIELWAALDDRPGTETWSETIWKVFAIKGEQPRHAVVRRWILLILLAWTSAHFLTGGRF
jgi:hypothetical protein